MLDISIWEILLVGVVALVVLGPERLPTALARVGRALKEAREMWAKTRQEFEQAFNEKEE